MNSTRKSRTLTKKKPSDHLSPATRGASPCKIDGDSGRKIKLAAIHKALLSDPVDVATLRKLAISHGGLLNDELRRKAWPKLLNVNVFEIPPKPDADVTSHRDYHQVVLDVNRSLRRFPPGMRNDQREVLQEQLINVIVRVLLRNKQLHYYQGYHDICVTFLLVVGQDLAFALIEKLSTHHLRDFMDRTMDSTKHILNYLLPIIGKANPELREFMDRSTVGTVFALAWLITWYGHVLSDFRSVVRLYDFFLACHPLMPVYLAAAIVLHRETEVLSGECEMTYVHSLLSKIPQDLPFENLISRAGDLFVQYPPTALAKEARLQYKQSSTLSKHDEFEQTSLRQRPDTILRQRKKGKLTTSQLKDINKKEHSPVVKVAIWAITASVGAALFAVLNTAAEWM
ncbi:TBC1 domain family member 20-like [Saccoglossus kowalevskii]|uniref:TBC1 domain family member 20-like n=1 Tax=Saccoglossus kowalevskii TaxID=10224 RepID=A0ABM0GS50_SACKO|nr:PREDICTED: TBC1 domain family member 20-like [Saccoglossus kowalevskii]